VLLLVVADSVRDELADDPVLPDCEAMDVEFVARDV
jgi:hypothetical protein